MQVSNVIFDFDDTRLSGSRVIAESVQGADEPWDLNHRYAVGTKNDLMLRTVL
jgi:hypothetical protein